MKNFTKEKIINTIKQIADNQNFEWINEYKDAKTHLLFKHKISGFITKGTWSTLKQKGKIPTRNTLSYHESRLQKLCLKYNFTALSSYVNYLTCIKYKCNICNTTYNRKLHDIYKCGTCNNFYKDNKGVNKTTVLRTPYVPYKLYFVYLPTINAYKIGIYKGKYVKSRFNSLSVEVLNVLNLPLYKAYYIEQYIINIFKDNKYTGPKFGGYTEAFNNCIDKNKVIEIMAASIEDVEPRELLEKLEAVNQQPSNVEIH
jgi:hypothetical protein